jgi:hypothetical protein
MVAVDTAVLLHKDRVGASRHWCAGENTNGFASLHCMFAGMTGSNAIDNGKPPLAHGINVVAANRIAVDRRIIERRQIDRRNDVRGKDAAERVAQRRHFVTGYRGYARADQPFSLGDREKRPVEGEAVVGKLRHYSSLRRDLFVLGGPAAA